MDFLEKLDFLMERDGLNKKTLSEKSGVPYTTIDGLYKKGYEKAKMPTLSKLADCFDVTLDYLIIDDISDVNYGKMHRKFHYDINEITDKELLVIEHYREASSEMKIAVDKILDINN